MDTESKPGPWILWGWIHEPLPMTPEQRAAAVKYIPPDHPNDKQAKRSAACREGWLNGPQSQKPTGKKKVRFTIEEVKFIKRELAKGVPQNVLADRLERTPSAIWAIEHGKAWKHVTI